MFECTVHRHPIPMESFSPLGETIQVPVRAKNKTVHGEATKKHIAVFFFLLSFLAPESITMLVHSIVSPVHNVPVAKVYVLQLHHSPLGHHGGGDTITKTDYHGLRSAMWLWSFRWLVGKLNSPGEEKLLRRWMAEDGVTEHFLFCFASLRKRASINMLIRY